MKKLGLGKRIGTPIYYTGIVSRALSSQTFMEKGFELTPEQYLILDLIHDYGEIYQRQICELTLKDRSNVARLIKILEEKELIRKEPASNGRRIYKITATEKGQQVRDSIKPTALKVRKTLRSGISEEELDITLATLQKIYDNARPLVKLQI